MFAYCRNNPTYSKDPYGQWTISITLGADITAFFFGAAISIGIAFDDNANIAVQWSYSAPNYCTNNETANFGVLDVGAGISLQITDDDTVDDLEGPTSYAGLTVGDGVYGGADMVYSGVEMNNRDQWDALPNGMQFTIGYGIGFDIHVRQTVTQTLWKANLNEVLQ